MCATDQANSFDAYFTEYLDVLAPLFTPVQNRSVNELFEFVCCLVHPSGVQGARAERRRELRDLRSKFELEGQQKTEDLVRTMDSALEKMATFTETIQVKHDKVNNRTITHKVTALTGRDYAAVVKQRNETMELATRVNSPAIRSPWRVPL